MNRFAKLSDAELLAEARRTAVEILGEEAADLSEEDLWAAIEDALLTDYEARDPESLTPAERRELARLRLARY